METKTNELIERSNELMKDIADYIKSKEWPYYFLAPHLANGSNKPIYNIMRDFPDSWSEYLEIVVISFNGTSIKVSIPIDEGDGNVINLDRYIFLSTFEKTIEMNKSLIGGAFNEVRINNLKEDIENLKKVICEKEKELNELVNK